MSVKIIVNNKKARFDYEVIDSLEGGLMLSGTEVKSMRNGKCNIAEGYIVEENNELFLKNINISPYSHGNINNHDPLRKRKILLHKKEIIRIIKAVKEKGITVIPLKFYFKDSLIKVEVGICKGKKLYDKRESIKERDTKKELDRHLKNKF